MFQCVLAGVGGQGTVLASRLIALAYMKENYHVKTTETIGMAQRGGSVTSHIRASKEAIHSTFVKEHSADLLLAFEPGEALRNIRFAHPKTTIIIHRQAVKPVTDALSKKDYDTEKIIQALQQDFTDVQICDFTDTLNEWKTNKVLNTLMLGFAKESSFPELSEQSFLHAMEELLPEKILPLNKKALELGACKGRRKI